MSGTGYGLRNKKPGQNNPPIAKKNTPITKKDATKSDQQKSMPKNQEIDHPHASTLNVDTTQTRPVDLHISKQTSSNIANETTNPPVKDEGTNPPLNNSDQDGTDGRTALMANSNTNHNPYRLSGFVMIV